MSESKTFRSDGDVTTHYIEPAGLSVFGGAEEKVPYKIKVWLLHSDEPIELDREYLDYGEDWLGSEAAKEGARMAAEGFWLSGGEVHMFLPPHRISLIEVERINV